MEQTISYAALYVNEEVQMKEVKTFIQHIDELQSIAPTLASALRGPFAGTAIKAIKDTISRDKGREVSSEEAINDLFNDPQVLQQIKELDKKFYKDMEELEVDVFYLEEEKKKKERIEEKRIHTPQMVLSVLFLVAYFTMLIAIFAIEISDKINMNRGENSMMGELQILFGVLTAGVSQILSYWFGGGILKKKSSQPDESIK